jgi:dTDP-4-dehydrorhamnose 3,5-epimerase
MKVIATGLAEVVLVEPKVFEDARGYTYESYNRRAFREATGVDLEVVQQNRSRSVKNVIRGIHYQLGRPQGKLIGVLRGEIYDVAVDLRRSSPNFGKWAAFRIAAEQHRFAWIPPGFGHAFLALSDTVELHYQLSEYWTPAVERIIRWNDPQLAIAWPLQGEPILSPRDAAAPYLAQAEVLP